MDRLTQLLTGSHAAGRRPWFASGYQGYPGAAGSLTNPAFGHLPAHMIAAGAELGMTPEETMAFAGARHRNVHHAAPPSYTQQVDAHAESLELKRHAEAAMLFDEGPKRQRRTNLALNSSITVPLATIPAGSAGQLTNTTLTNFRAYKYVVFSTGFFFSQTLGRHRRSGREQDARRRRDVRPVSAGERCGLQARYPEHARQRHGVQRQRCPRCLRFDALGLHPGISGGPLAALSFPSRKQRRPADSPEVPAGRLSTLPERTAGPERFGRGPHGHTRARVFHFLLYDRH